MSSAKNRPNSLWILIPLLALLIMPVGRGLWYYRGVTMPRDVPEPNLDGITVPTPRGGTFVDTPETGRGLVLFDRGHENSYSEQEISVLSSRLSSRGMQVIPYDGDENLALALAPASAFVVITPYSGFSEEEVSAVRNFVDKGGRLLLVADPTRFQVWWGEYYEDYDLVPAARMLNDLAKPFGLTFEEDYLYNVVEHEGNYQNIMLRDFEENALTQGLGEVAFYATHSIHSPDGGLILADENTHSSKNELGQNLAVAALGGEGRVLALGDLSFMTNPYAGVLDNDRLIAHIADFLAGAERRYELVDFPHFFSSEVNLIPLGPEEGAELSTAHILAVSKLQETFEQTERQLFIQTIDTERDAILLGLFEAAEEAGDYLDEAGIWVQMAEDEQVTATAGITLTIEGIGEVDVEGMALLYRHQGEGREVLVLLTDAEDNLDLMVESLASGDLSACAELSPTLALCALGEGGGWDDAGDGDDNGAGGNGAGGDGTVGNSILIVSDSDAEFDCFSGADFFDFALWEDYEVDLWYEYDGDEPTLDDLQDYDAVIWSTGNCSNTAPSETEAEVLRQYVAEGGRLIIEGMRIGADWSGSDFYSEVCHAESSGYAAQYDLEVVDASHPLAEGLAAGQIITFSEFFIDYGMVPDVVTALDDAQVIFARGPDSEGAGAASILVYEDTQTRIVYIAFPIYLLSDEYADPLILNAARWVLGE